MTYNKPEVVELNGALKAIQGVAKPPDMFPDQVRPPLQNATVGAYEADE